MDLSKLIKGKKYLINEFTGPMDFLDKQFLDDMKFMEFSHTTHRMDDGLKFYFKNGDNFEIIPDYTSDLQIFTNKIEAMKVWTDITHPTKLKLTKCFINELEQSQQQNPELWV